jgi:hypothetical protein
MYGSQVIVIVQIVTVLLCTAVAFGLLLSTMLVRGKLHAIGSEGPLHDIAFTEKAYVAASLFCGVGCLASLGLSWGTFAVFMSVGAAFMIADQYLVPRMRQAISAGRPVPLTGARARFELMAATSLFLVFWKTAVPPLVTLAMVYGIS